jgi:WD40 repeat protein
MLAATYGQVEMQQPTVGSFARGSQVKIWDVKTGREVRSLASGDLPHEAEFSTDGRTIATIGSMGQISLWDAQSGTKRDLTSSPMAGLTNMGNIGNIKPGKMPTMPNMNFLRN